MLKNVPTDTSLVLCTTNPGLNRDQSLSVSDSLKDNKLTYNTLEVNQPLTDNEDLPSPMSVTRFIRWAKDSPDEPGKGYIKIFYSSFDDDIERIFINRELSKVPIADLPTFLIHDNRWVRNTASYFYDTKKV